MTGRENMAAALGAGGAEEIPAVICYEGIYIRDHWDQLSSRPWWHLHSYRLDQQLQWRREYHAKTPCDWFQVPAFPPREIREATVIHQRPDGVYRINRRTGAEERLRPPVIGGWDRPGARRAAALPPPPETAEEVDAAIPAPEPFHADEFVAAGCADLATALLDELGGRRAPAGQVSSPFWQCYGDWGFEGLMTLVADRPELALRASRRHLAHDLQQARRCAALGARIIWIEECLTDLIRPATFAEMNAPLVGALVEEIRRLGMKSVYYYCGDPSDRWELLFSAGADALALEESKKGFTIDVEQAIERAAGRCALFGNLDAIGLLEHGSEDALRAEIARQIAAGRRSGGRFVMSLGSPVTPGTPVHRLRRYLDIAHELGAA
jgi:hypothetical protein